LCHIFYSYSIPSGLFTYRSINHKAEIDRLVYELYGLTEEEIRIVEGNLTPSGV